MRNTPDGAPNSTRVAPSCEGQTAQGRAGYYERLLDIMPDALVLYDLEGRVLYVNDAFVQLYGWTRNEIYGKRMDFLPPSEAQRTAEAVSRALTGENVRMLVRRFTKDGRMLDILLITSLMRDDEGKRLGIYVVHRDLTERRALAAALEESEKLYRTLLDASPDPISVYTAEGKITYVNPAFEQTFGWTIKELSGHGVDFVPASEQEATRDAVRRTMEGETVELDTCRLTKEGNLLDIQLKTAVFRDSDGHIAGDIVIYRDTTGHKRIERELESHSERLEELVRQRTAALTESRERFRELAEMLPEIVFEVDLSGTMRFINKLGVETFGIKEGTPLSAIDLLARVVPEDRPRLAANLKLNLTGKLERGIEYTFLKGGGQRFPAMAITSPIFSRGEVIGLRGIIVDMSAHRSMEEQLRHAAKMEAVGTLAGGIAHDFNNILQTILGQVQLMQAQPCDFMGFIERAKHIEHAAERAAGLVRQLMTFGSKADAVVKPTDLNAEIRRGIELLERTLPKMINLTVDLSGDVPLVLAAPSQLLQIILNLCTNARDAMRDGGRLTITTRPVALSDLDCVSRPELEPGVYLLLTVADNGDGMDPETLTHIYEPFYTTKAVGMGSGLGLSTVYGIVKNHGGLIECDSRKGVGTTFRIYLPTTGEVEEKPQLEVEKPAIATGEETILVADDDGSVLELARAILEHQGYTVLTAESGEAALEMFCRTPRRFDLVILDLGMPGMGGRRCMEAMLEIEPAARIIVSSGYSQEREAAGIIEAGAREFVGKPYRLADLGNKVRAILDQP